jgi:hypothetical protein
MPLPDLTSAVITALIPARNEAGRIGGVLDVLRQVSSLSEIIVIDDGSSDATADEVRQTAASDARLIVMTHPVNRGKGQAIYTGWQAAHGSFLLLLDADLVMLKPAHVDDLLRPVVSGQADMTIGLFVGGRKNTDLSHRLTPWLSGQRGLRAEMLAAVPWQAAAGYGFETALTIAAQEQNWRVQHVTMRGVWHPPSEHHRGWLRGFLNRMSMYAQIGRAWLVTRGLNRRDAHHQFSTERGERQF